jgi:hypothetical protein
MGDNSPCGRRKYWMRHSKEELVRELIRLEARRETQPVRYLNKFSGTCVTLEQQPNAADDEAVYAPLFTTPYAPVYPEKLPCAVHLLPGLKLGTGVATQTLLEALARREKYNTDIGAMTVDERAKHFAATNAVKAMQPQSDHLKSAIKLAEVASELADRIRAEELTPPSVPTFDEWLESTGNKPLGWVREVMEESYNACRTAILGGNIG